MVTTELQRIPRCLRPQHDRQLWACMYMPQLGFAMRLEGTPLSASLAATLSDYQLAFEGVVEGREAWFYTCNATRELDEQYGDVLHAMRDIEVCIDDHQKKKSNCEEKIHFLTAICAW